MITLYIIRSFEITKGAQGWYRLVLVTTMCILNSVLIHNWYADILYHAKRMIVLLLGILLLGKLNRLFL